MEPYPTSSDLSTIEANEPVMLSGELLTARDATLKQIFSQNKTDVLRDRVIYFCGPTPPPPGRVIGSCGPTTSARMEPYFAYMTEAGVKALIGKGDISKAAREVLRNRNVPYFSAVGGAGAFLSQKVTASRLVLFPELGPEAVYRLTVENFPVVRL